jgi:uncharacterized protein (DUF362 family)/Pyruvate/2-oxoacid:ferredoxin oxidoreductase delta subunit
MASVSFSSCQDYQESSVLASVSKSLEALGGMAAFVKPGQKVLIKPNLLSAKRPVEAITTHPAVLEAVIVLVKQAGGVPIIGDSPGGKITDLKTYWETTGTADVCRRQKAELVSFEKSGVYEKRLGNRKYYIARPVLEADVIINLPKLKTHSLTVLTCAVKNMFGVVPGIRKSMHHREEPKPREFSGLVVDIFSLAKPHLNIVDAVVGMEGAGPSAGDPKELGFIMAGSDGVAVDAAAAYLLGMEPFKVPTTAIAHKRGLGQGDIKNIELTGDVPGVKSDFRWPSLWRYSLIPSSLARAGARLFWIRPVIDPLKCVNCGACVESCPVSALSTAEPTPVFNYRLCINCLCCQEICPEHAIFQKKSLLAGLLR